MRAGGCPCTCSIEWHQCICITLQWRASTFVHDSKTKQKTYSFSVPTPWEWSSRYSYPIACAMNIVSFWSGNFWGCFSTFFSFVKLTKSDGWSLEARVVLTSATNQESQKFNFWQSELSRRFSGHCCTFTEMALFLWALHSKNTRIPLTLFVWVFAGTKPFNIAISSLLVRHLNWAPSSRVIFAFFLGGWKTLKSGSTFSFLTILKMSKTTTGSCIDHSKCVTVLLRDAWQPHDFKPLPWYKPARPLAT